MSIAEKLTTIAENEQRVYESGTKTENERFWNLLQKRVVWVSGVGNVEEITTDYSQRFKNWYTATEIKPLYPIEIDRVTSNMFESCVNLESLPPMTFLQPVSTYAMFNGCNKIKEAICDFRLTGNCGAMFNQCQNLTKIDKMIIEGAVTWSMLSFAGCRKLVELNIEGVIDSVFTVSDCQSLNRASITNIVNIARSTTITFSKAAVNKAFETYEGANNGSTSPDSEWFALKDSNTSCTIALI